MKKAFTALLVLIIVTLVALLIFGPAIVDKNQNMVVAHQPYKVSEAAKALHQNLLVGDWHADSTLWNRDLGQRSDYGQLDIPRMQAGNQALQMFTTVTKSPSGLNYDHNESTSSDDITRLAMVQLWPTNTWQSLTARALFQARKLHKVAEHYSKSLMLIKSQRDLDEWLTLRKKSPKLVGGLIGTEGSHALDGKLENIQVLFDAGFRMMSLQHFFDNKLGGSLHGVSQAGLSEFGKQALQKMQALNIIVDVAHSSEQVVRDVLSVSTRPLVVSHTGFKGHCDTARNIPDKLMQAIATNGGLIAVGYWPGAICGTHPKKIAQAITYGISLVGDDHVALGSDFDGSVTVAIDASELAAITHELLVLNVPESSIRKVMGLNMLRFLQAQLPNQDIAP